MGRRMSVGRGDGGYAVPWCSGERVGLLFPAIFSLVILDRSVGTGGVSLQVYHHSVCELGTVIIPLHVARTLPTTVEAGVLAVSTAFQL